MAFGNGHAVPLRRCGPLWVMLCSLFIPAAISSMIAPKFSTFLLDGVSFMHW